MEKHQHVTETTFNRYHLWKPIIGDVAAAALSATLITPVIAVIDQYVSSRPHYTIKLTYPQING
jgi:hypothetical protein